MKLCPVATSTISEAPFTVAPDPITRPVAYGIARTYPAAHPRKHILPSGAPVGIYSRAPGAGKAAVPALSILPTALPHLRMQALLFFYEFND